LKRRVLDLQTGLAVARRRWRRLLAAGGIGLVLGLGYVLVVPAGLTSTALVLLPSPEDPSDPSVAPLTQITIALSSVVLQRAGQSVTPRLSADEVAGRVSVSAPSSQLLQIDATETEAAVAQALAQALTEAYVSTVREAARSLSVRTMSELRKRETTLAAQVSELQKQIDATSARLPTENPASADSRRDAQLLAQLHADQADMSLELDRVKDSIYTSEAQGSASQAATTIIQSASPATGPGQLRRLTLCGGNGSLMAVLVAMVVFLIQHRRDPRLRARDDLADAVGSVVVGEVSSRPQQTVAGWSTLLETHETGPVEEWAFRQALRALTGSQPSVPLEGRQGSRLEHPRSLTVICLAGDERGLSIGPQLAVLTASSGIPTRLVASGGGEWAASLWAACAGTRSADARPRLELVAGTEPVAVPEPEPEPGRESAESPGEGEDAAEGDDRVERAGPVEVPEAGMTIVLTVVDPGGPDLGAVPWTASTVLAVAAGTATKVELARLAVAVDSSGRQVDGVIVADPDPADRTTGRRTLDRRVRQTPLPLRVTGASSAVHRGIRRGPS
jgi:hypothetical protein